LWKWIDAHGKEYGIGRPYLDKDPPHIGPIDGQEYADKRGLNAKLAEKGSAAKSNATKGNATKSNAAKSNAAKSNNAKSGVAKAAKPLQALQGRGEPKPL
jgi:hypothetical protein